MELVRFPVQLFISSIEAILIVSLGLQMLGIKPSLRQIALIGISQGIFGAFVDLMNFPFGIHTLIHFMLFILVISLVMMQPFKTSFVTTLLGFGIYICIEAVWFSLLLKLTGTTLAEVEANVWLKLSFFITVAAAALTAILLFIRFNISLTGYFGASSRLNIFNDKSSSLFSKAYPLIVLFLVQNLFIVLFYSINYASTNNPQIKTTLISYPYISIAIIALLTLSAVKMVKKVIMQVSREIETQVQISSLKNVEELVNSIRIQRHDFSHHLQTVYGLLEVGAFKEASDYIKGTLLDVTITSELVKTDNLGLTALLYTKMGLAEAHQIDFSVDIRASLKNLIIPDRDINAIIGNLLDNAFQAVKNLHPVDRKVDLTVDQDLNGYIFLINNAGMTLDPIIKEKIFEPGFSTKSEGKGMGLYSADKLVKKYKGNISVVSEQGLTSFCVVIPDGGK